MSLSNHWMTLKRWLALLLPPLFALPVHAQWRSIGSFESYQSEDPKTVVVKAGQSRLRISVLTTDLVRVQLAPEGTFPNAPSWAVVQKEWPVVRPVISESPSELRISTGELTLIISKNPVRLSFLDRTGEVLNQDDPARGMAWEGKEVRVWKIMPQDEHYYGFGEKAGSLNRKFKHMSMWNSDIPAYRADTDPLYKSIPFFYGIRNGRTYGIFLDNSHWSSFDMGKESPDRYSFGAIGGELDYYFIAGPSPAAILSRYTELTGRMPLPPLWSLGYQQSR